MGLQKAKLVPLKFAEINEREEEEYRRQMDLLREIYGGIAEFLEPVTVGEKLPAEADVILFPQLLFAAYRHDDDLKGYSLPILILTSRYGTIEMWDWEIVTYLKGLGCRVFSPHTIEMGKTVIRACAVKKKLAEGAKFLLFQDSPGEGKQANIFKKFYWWEEKSARLMQEAFGCRLIYRSWKELNERAGRISMEEAGELCRDWNIAREDVPEDCYYRAVRIYAAIKREAEALGGVDGVGANCLNESFYSDSTPCLAWNMLFERDDIIWACEGDTLSLLSLYIVYNTLEKPVMMTNLYPFLMGMSALSHEKIASFPEVEDPDNHALAVHCGYFGFMPRKLCSRWTLRPKVLEIVDDHACMTDCRMPEGPVTLVKIYPDFQKLSIIRAEIERYVQYPGSDCRNGALIRYRDGERVMEELCSHHSLIVEGDVAKELKLLAAVFGWKILEI